MLRNFFIKMHQKARSANGKKILSFLEKDHEAYFLDLGCDNGDWTMMLAEKIGTTRIYGVEIIPEKIKFAQAKGVDVQLLDLNSKFLYQSNFFDVVHANQVIEHLYDTDNFVEEIFRVLKPGGYALISTENLSSWHNIFALVFGFQPFSMSNFSKKGNIGNPFSLWRNRESENSHFVSWQHRRLFSFFGLKDLFLKHGFIVESIKTSGYYPLFSSLSKIDPIHGHYIVYKIRKGL